MTYEEKLECAFKELEATPLFEVGQRPLGFRLLRLLGIKAVPAYYRSFRRYFLLDGFLLGAVFGLSNVPAGWMVSEYGPLAERGANVLCGVLFALHGAWWHRSIALKHGLSSWEDLGSENNSSAPQ